MNRTSCGVAALLLVSLGVLPLRAAQGTGNFNFSYQTGGSTPASQVGNVCSTPSSASFSATTQVFSGGYTWVSVSPTSGTTTVCPTTTPNLTVSINPAGLGPGTYTGQVIVNVTGSSNNPLTLPVSLTVTCGAPILKWTNNSGALFFNYVIGGNLPGGQAVQLSSDCGPVSFTATSNATWLTNAPTSGTTPATISVQVDPSKTLAGTSYGQITITAAGAVGSPITVYNVFNVRGYDGLTYTQYPLPIDGVGGIAAGPDGAVWFTAPNDDLVWRITPDGFSASFPLVPKSGLGGITLGSDGALWFTEGANTIIGKPAKIGRITTAGIVTEYPVPTSNVNFGGVTTGPDGAVWFTEFYNGDKIGRITTTGVVTEFSVPGSGPSGIVRGPDGALWFCEYLSNKIGRITTAGAISEFSIPTPQSGPISITSGPDGALWFTEILVRKIGRISTSGVVTEYALPPEAAQIQFGPLDITTGPDGNLWFTLASGPLIGRITTSGVFTFYNGPLDPGGSGAPIGLSPIRLGPDGALWVGPDSYWRNRIIRITASTVADITPSRAVAGTQFFTLTVNGSGFQSGAAVSWNGTILSTTFVNPNRLTATVPSSLISTPGIANVAVSLNGLFSNALKFTIAPASVPPSAIGVYRNGVWYVDANANGAWDSGTDRAFGWGFATSIPILGDWNGNGKTKVGIFDNGAWYLDVNGNGIWDAGDLAFGWGNPTATPIVGDWNGDGKSKIGVFDHGVWYLDMNGSGTWDASDRSFGFGSSTAVPVTGDWDGDGRTKIGVYDQGIWYLDFNGNGAWDAGDRAFGWGFATSIPIIGDWDGSGRSKVGVFDHGVWYLDMNGSGSYDAGDRVFGWGASTATPIIGDWNGDGRSKIGVFDQGLWYLDYNGDGVWQITDRAFGWGFGTDKPVVGKW